MAATEENGAHHPSKKARLLTPRGLFTLLCHGGLAAGLAMAGSGSQGGLPILRRARFCYISLDRSGEANVGVKVALQRKSFLTHTKPPATHGKDFRQRSAVEPDSPA